MKNKYCLMLWFVAIPYLSSFGQWEEQNSGVEANLWDISFVDSPYGWALTDSSLILSTTDGGGSWNQNKVSFEANGYHKIMFLDRNNGFVLGKKLFKTTDSGISWEEIKPDTTLSMGV